jgi:hypothetical protein
MDIGWIEGWPFATGHLVQVFFSGFQPQLLVAP